MAQDDAISQVAEVVHQHAVRVIEGIDPINQALVLVLVEVSTVADVFLLRGRLKRLIKLLCMRQLLVLVESLLLVGESVVLLEDLWGRGGLVEPLNLFLSY